MLRYGNVHRRRECILVSTMGGQAQVVTFALDDLLARGEEVRDVFVLHLSPADPRVQRALDQLADEFARGEYQGRPCRLHLRAIRTREGLPLADIRDESDADQVWMEVYHLLSELKGQGRRLHLCIAGGRRIMGVLALSAAMLLFGHQDCVWHMYTPREFLARARDGAILHARPEDGVRLIQVPMVPWGSYFPALRELTLATAGQVVAEGVRWLEEADRRRCEEVLARLTRRQREVLHAFACGDTPQEVAERLHITLKTVDTHKTVILGECRNAWGVPEGSHLTYHFLREKFGPFRHRRLR
ncbi:MAG: histidine kinase [Anaerolineae bacterium]|nr:histidine kinase [Anaerolineae bacterium]